MASVRAETPALSLLTFLSCLLLVSVWRAGGVVQAEWNWMAFAFSVAAIVWWLLRREERKITVGPWGWLLLLYVAFQMLPMPISMLSVVAPFRAQLTQSLQELGIQRHFDSVSVNPSATLHHWLRLAVYLLTFFMVRDLSLSLRRWMWYPAIAPVAIGVAAAAYAFFAPGGSQGGSFHGPYVNRNHFAGFLEMTLPFSVGLLLARVRSFQAASVSGAWMMCAWLACSLILMAALLRTGSKMGFVSTAAALVAMIVVWYRRTIMLHRLKASVAILACLAAVLAVGFFESSRAQITQLIANDSVQLRLSLWEESIRLISSYPLFGCGLGAYESAMYPFKTSQMMLRYDYVHNDYLQLVAELGIAGLVFLLPLMVLIIRTVSGRSFIHSSESRLLAMACTGSFVAIGLHSLADFNLYIPANALLLSWICGIASAQQVTG